MIVGSDYRVLAASESFCSRFTGGEDPVGRFCFDLLHRSRPPCSGSGGRCPLALADRAARPTVHLHLTCLGFIYEQVTATPLPATDDRPKAFLLVTRPLGARRCPSLLVGASPILLQLLRRVVEIAGSPRPVVIRGEPGTGKACIARLIHDLSDRRSGGFVPVDCSGTEGRRLEPDLFGSTGSMQPKSAGLIDSAAGGTLYLREPHHLPPSLQQRIGRVLTGADDSAACRWIFSCEDPAARLGLLDEAPSEFHSLLNPPLRDRREDLPMILDALTRRFGAPSVPAVSAPVLAMLASYDFPGNLRELECLVERACLLAEGAALLPEHFPSHVRSLSEAN